MALDDSWSMTLRIDPLLSCSFLCSAKVSRWRCRVIKVYTNSYTCDDCPANLRDSSRRFYQHGSFIWTPVIFKWIEAADCKRFSMVIKVTLLASPAGITSSLWSPFRLHRRTFTSLRNSGILRAYTNGLTKELANSSDQTALIIPVLWSFVVWVITSTCPGNHATNEKNVTINRVLASFLFCWCLWRNCLDRIDVNHHIKM